MLVLRRIIVFLQTTGITKYSLSVSKTPRGGGICVFLRVAAHATPPLSVFLVPSKNMLCRLSGLFWYGRRCFTHSGEDNLHVLIQGDLDTSGDIFDKAVAAFEKETKDMRGNSGMLEIVSRMTSGDILELGTDEDTSELLHKVVEDENTKKIRMLVTADSDSSWLTTHSAMISTFHQFVFVPLHHQVPGCQYEYQDRARKANDDNLPLITCKHLNTDL